MAKRLPAKRARRPNPRADRNIDENVISFSGYEQNTRNRNENGNSRNRRDQQRHPDRSETFKPKKLELIPRNLAQEEYLDALYDEDNAIVFAMGPAGTGKAQPLDSLVLTKDGWIKMGDISVGTKILNAHGVEQSVIGVFPQGLKQIYKITFEDGRTTECCAEHLWEIHFWEWDEPRIINTIKLIEMLKLKSRTKRLYVRLYQPSLFEETKKLPIDPYVLGCLIGDGSLTHDLGFTTADEETVLEISSRIFPQTVCKTSHKNGYGYRILDPEAPSSQGTKGIFRNRMKISLNEIGLLGKSSATKFIPQIYLDGSTHQRLELLRGLMDTDGTCDKCGSLSYSTVSKELAKNFQYLVRSLGGICKIKEKKTFYTYNGAKKEGQLSYNCSVRLRDPQESFLLERKKTKVSKNYQYKDILKLRITDIEQTELKEAQCILVDHPEHLYVTNDFIVTHNTMLATQFAIKGLLEGRFKKIVITRPAVSVDEQHGYLPGTLIEKLAPWVVPIMDVFKEVYPVSVLEKMMKEEIIEISPLAYMRGRAQPFDSVIQTPSGQRRMGDLKVGDSVLGSNGSATKVDGIFPQGKKPIYRVFFSDGVSTLASGDHLWNTRTRSEKRHDKGFTTKTTEEIIESGIWNKWKGKNIHRNHEVPVMSSPASFISDSILPINSYILGLLLGDGSIHDKASIGYTTVDTELTEAIKDVLPNNMKITDTGRFGYRISHYQKVKHINPNPLKGALRDLDLSGCRSYEKFIPSCYLNASTNDRLAILQGLMDTDGTIWLQKKRKTARVQFSSTSIQLANDVSYLVRSLGGTALVHERKHNLKKIRKDRPIHHRRNSFVVEIALPSNICPFRLQRKVAKFGKQMVSRFIDRIELVGDMECQCISVTASDHLYLTDDFIVTHNTFKNACVIADEMQNATPSQMKMLLTRIGDESRMFVTGDLRQHDRGFEANGLKDFVERLSKTVSNSIEVCEFGPGDVERHPVIEEILRIYDREVD